MLYAGLDLSRQRLDVHVLDEAGRTVEGSAVRLDDDALRTLATHVLLRGQEVTAAVESMTGFAHADPWLKDAITIRASIPRVGGRPASPRSLGHESE